MKEMNKKAIEIFGKFSENMSCNQLSYNILFSSRFIVKLITHNENPPKEFYIWTLVHHALSKRWSHQKPYSFDLCEYLTDLLEFSENSKEVMLHEIFLGLREIEF